MFLGLDSHKNESYKIILPESFDKQLATWYLSLIWYVCYDVEKTSANRTIRPNPANSASIRSWHDGPIFGRTTTNPFLCQNCHLYCKTWWPSFLIFFFTSILNIKYIQTKTLTKWTNYFLRVCIGLKLIVCSTSFTFGVKIRCDLLI